MCFKIFVYNSHEDSCTIVLRPLWDEQVPGQEGALLEHAAYEAAEQVLQDGLALQPEEDLPRLRSSLPEADSSKR